MEGQLIVREFLKADFLITPEEFSELDIGNYMEFLEKKINNSKSETKTPEINIHTKIIEVEKKENKSILEKNTDNITQNNTKQKTITETENKLKINIVSTEKRFTKREINAIDVSVIYSEKFNEVKDILTERLEPISINKIEGDQKKINIIGMISQKTNNGFMLEDETGTINVITTKKTNIRNDDVVGVLGHIKNGNLFSDDVIFPDISLGNESMLNKMTISFDFTKTEYVKIGESELQIRGIIQTISIDGENKNNIIFYRPKSRITINDAVDIIRKRCVTIKEGIAPSFFVIRDVPDMFIISQRETVTEKTNYKGVRIMITGDSDSIETGV